MITKEELLTLIDESYGALGWLEGTINLSDRQRLFKAKKLRDALELVEKHLSDAIQILPSTEVSS